MYSLNPLNILSINCQGIKGNLQYYTHMLNMLNNQCDITCFCEHWLNPCDMFTMRFTYRHCSKWTNFKSGMDDDDSNGTGRPYGGVITRKLQDVTGPPHDVLQDDARLSVMELRYQGSTCLTVVGVHGDTVPVQCMLILVLLTLKQLLENQHMVSHND